MRFATGKEKGIGRVGCFGFSDRQTETRTDGIRSLRRRPVADRTTAQVGRLSGRRASGRSDSSGPGECWTALPVVVGAYPQQITKDMNFLVEDYSSSYNAIIGRPTLNSWKAITSTYHMSIKFPTDYKVGQVQGDQLAAKECYLAMLAMDEQVQTMKC